MPQLVLTDDMFTLSYSYVCRQLEKYKLVSAIFHFLLLHNGPDILEFVCSVGHLRMDSEFVQIISYLARGNKVKGFVGLIGCVRFTSHMVGTLLGHGSFKWVFI
ncbi:hypothetical protein HanHA89_Chr16g0681511 [Helianthus annuus]|nr:hypothetical protein HanHA89_Chr16g0681511 [Helianthus annuus]